MPRYIITVEQWVQEIASVEVEAATPQRAFLRVLDHVNAGLIEDWSDGNDSSDQRIVEVRDEAGFLCSSEDTILEWYSLLEEQEFVIIKKDGRYLRRAKNQ